jgi:hypothetical protein
MWCRCYAHGVLDAWLYVFAVIPRECWPTGAVAIANICATSAQDIDAAGAVAITQTDIDQMWSHFQATF